MTDPETPRDETCEHGTALDCRCDDCGRSGFEPPVLLEESFTPGPWRWLDYPDGRKLLTAPSRAVIHCPDAAMSCDPPDAELIAAAPDLYLALTEMVALYDGLRDILTCQSVIEKLRRADLALQKANGQ